MLYQRNYWFKNFITVIYILIDDIYQEVISAHIKKYRNIKNAILSDSEIIIISIVGELLTIDSEKAWLGFCRRNLRDLKYLSPDLKAEKGI